MQTRSKTRRAKAATMPPGSAGPPYDAAAAEGTRIIVTPSATGVGTHTRWIRPTHTTPEDDPSTTKKLLRKLPIETETPRPNFIISEIPMNEGVNENSRETEAADEFAEEQDKKVTYGKMGPSLDTSGGGRRRVDSGGALKNHSGHGTANPPSNDAPFILGPPFPIHYPLRQVQPTPPGQDYIPVRLGPTGTLLIEEECALPDTFDYKSLGLGPCATHLVDFNEEMKAFETQLELEFKWGKSCS